MNTIELRQAQSRHNIFVVFVFRLYPCPCSKVKLHDEGVRCTLLQYLWVLAMHYMCKHILKIVRES